jgi:hypothetical protein
VKWAILGKSPDRGISYFCYEGFVYIDSSRTFTEARQGEAKKAKKARRRKPKKRGERRGLER